MLDLSVGSHDLLHDVELLRLHLLLWKGADHLPTRRHDLMRGLVLVLLLLLHRGPSAHQNVLPVAQLDDLLVLLWLCMALELDLVQDVLVRLCLQECRQRNRLSPGRRNEASRGQSPHSSTGHLHSSRTRACLCTIPSHCYSSHSDSSLTQDIVPLLTAVVVDVLQRNRLSLLLRQLQVVLDLSTRVGLIRVRLHRRRCPALLVATLRSTGCRCCSCLWFLLRGACLCGGRERERESGLDWVTLGE